MRMLMAAALAATACGGTETSSAAAIQLPLHARLTVLSDPSPRVDTWDLALGLVINEGGDVSGTGTLAASEYVCDDPKTHCNISAFSWVAGAAVGSIAGDTLDVTLSLPAFKWTAAVVPLVPTTVRLQLTGVQGGISGYTMRGTATVQGMLNESIPADAARPVYR